MESETATDFSSFLTAYRPLFTEGLPTLWGAITTSIASKSVETNATPSFTGAHHGNDGSWAYIMDTYFALELKDTIAVVLCALVFLALRYVCDRILLKRWADNLNLLPGDKHKFPESLWKVAVYGLFWAYEWYLLYGSGRFPYLTDLDSQWEGYTPKMAVEPEIWFLYIVQMGFCVSSMMTMWTLDVEKSDNLILIVHHVVTLCLLAFSYSFRFHRPGVCVLYCHDLCDVLLDGAKVAHYMSKIPKLKQSIAEFWDNVSTACFLSLCFAWVYFRFYLYPTRCLYTSAYVWPKRVPDAPMYILFNCWLFSLLFMHIYWFGLLLRVLFSYVLGKKIADIRENEDASESDAKGLPEKMTKEEAALHSMSKEKVSGAL